MWRNNEGGRPSDIDFVDGLKLWLACCSLPGVESRTMGASEEVGLCGTGEGFRLAGSGTMGSAETGIGTPDSSIRGAWDDGRASGCWSSCSTAGPETTTAGTEAELEAILSSLDARTKISCCTGRDASNNSFEVASGNGD